MAPDASGNDVAAVGIPLTGKIAFAAYGTALPTGAQMYNSSFALPAEWKNPGLLTEDGGFNYDETRSDPVKFFQDGYEITLGTGDLILTIKLAESSETVRQITRGKTADANGTMEIDIDGDPLRYSVYTEEVYKNGVMRRRACANAWVRSVKQDQSTRGAVDAVTLTLAIKRDAAHGMGHFRETLLPFDTTPNPYISSITPSGESVGGQVLVQGYNLTPITSMTFDGVTVAAGGRVEMNSGAVLVTIPTGAAGASDVIITTANGASNTVSYTTV